MSTAKYFSALGGHPAQTELLTGRAVFTEAYAVLPNGVLRDIVCNEVPMVFRDGKPYAICAFFGCWFYIALQYTSVSDDVALWSSAALITAMRLLAWRFDLKIGRP